MARKSRKPLDPHAEREAQRYATPTASRELILSYLEDRGTPASLEEIAHALHIEQPETFEGLRRRLIAMSRDGQLACNRRGLYGLVKRMNLVRGRVQGHKDGYGFLIPDTGESDFYLSSRQMSRVFDGDIVLVRPERNEHRGKKEAVIVEVIERRTEEVVGRFYQESGMAFVVPDNVRISQDIIVPEHAINGAGHGQYVTVKIIRQPEMRSGPVGEVFEILGDHMAPGMEIDVALRTHAIPFRWPAEVEAEAAQFSGKLTERDKAHRVDLRDLPLVTIDGEDARDFDDAVYCTKKRSGGWRLYVAIADVSQYVHPGSALDKEAFQRGNSVYFPDHVVPMLPEALSNGLCSLNPNVDRACMVCEMTISNNGKLSGYRFYEALMHSKARLTYNQVGALLQDPDSPDGRLLSKKHPDIISDLLELHKLYLVLRAAREERGAIDFDTVETRILFDKERKIDRIIPVIRNDAHKVIEECMLCANVAAAQLFTKAKLPALYRVHEGPSEERLANLQAFLRELGLILGGGDNPQTSDYQELCEQIKGRPDAMALQTVMLRSLSQASYQAENLGHFGLGYKAYTHFTSPIRRYPDLLVHRAIRHLIRQSDNLKQVRKVSGAPNLPKSLQYRFDDKDLATLGEQCSMTERRADDATRDVMSWLKCEYLTQHVGEKFGGIVSAVTAFGLFVELTDLYVEGLVHVSSLKQDYYQFDAQKHRLVGERTGTTFRLGDEVKVQVMRVGLEDRKVDLELIGLPRSTKGKASRSSKRDKILAQWNDEYQRMQNRGKKAKGKSTKQSKSKGAVKKTSGLGSKKPKKPRKTR